MLVQVYSYNSAKYNNNNLSFTSKTSKFSTEYILSLIESKRTVKEIRAELGGIAHDTYYKLLVERGIIQKPEIVLPKHLESVTKAEIEGLLKDNVSISNICKIYNINVYTYRKLVEKLGVVHPKKSLAERVGLITEKQIRECIDDKLTVKQTCARLGITVDSYYDLLKKFNIETQRMSTIVHNASITKETFKKMIDDKVPYKKILSELHISSDVYNSLLVKFGIVTESKMQKNHISSITREDFLKLVESGLPVSKICEILEIPVRTYSRLLDKFGIVTERKASKANISAVTKERLQSLVSIGMPVKTICEVLGIGSESTFYKLLKRLDIDYDYLHHSNEILIPNTRLREVVEADTTIAEKTKELGISQTAYSEKSKIAHIPTVLRDSIDKLVEVPSDELQKAVDLNLTIEQICENFNITRSNYFVLIRKHNIQTPYRRSLERISKISKYHIQKLRDLGKSPKQICEILNIGSGTYSRILAGTAGNTDFIA